MRSDSVWSRKIGGKEAKQLKQSSWQDLEEGGWAGYRESPLIPEGAFRIRDESLTVPIVTQPHSSAYVDIATFGDFWQLIW